MHARTRTQACMQLTAPSCALVRRTYATVAIYTPAVGPGRRREGPTRIESNMCMRCAPLHCTIRNWHCCSWSHGLYAPSIRPTLKMRYETSRPEGVRGVAKRPNNSCSSKIVRDGDKRGHCSHVARVHTTGWLLAAMPSRHHVIL